MQLLQHFVRYLIFLSLWVTSTAKSTCDIDSNIWKLCPGGLCLYKWSKCPCTHNEYLCPDETCVRHGQLCPGSPCGSFRKQCLDGSCVYTHEPCACERYCDDGSCVRWSVLCPGECPSGKWPCADHTKCILESYKCDGTINCPDASDEVGCPVPVSQSHHTTVNYNLLCGMIIGIVLLILTMIAAGIGLVCWKHRKRTQAMQRPAPVPASPSVPRHVPQLSASNSTSSSVCSCRALLSTPTQSRDQHRYGTLPANTSRQETPRYSETYSLPTSTAKQSPMCSCRVALPPPRPSNDLQNNDLCGFEMVVLSTSPTGTKTCLEKKGPPPSYHDIIKT